MSWTLSKVNDVITRGCEVCGVGLLVALVALTLLRIVARQIGVSLSWPGQVAQYLLVYFTFLALPILFRTDEDISFRPLLKRFSYATQRTLFLICDTLLILFCVFLGTSAIYAAQLNMSVGLSSVDWLKVGYGYLFIGLMFVLLIPLVVEEMLQYWRRLNESMSEQSATTTPSD